MTDLENIILSPWFTALLAVIGGYLFIVIAREFYLWFSKFNTLYSKLESMDDKLNELQDTVSKLKSQPRDEDATPLPPVPRSEPKEQFPFAH